MASNFVRAAYREVVDLNTESNKVSAIGIHTPTGDTPRKMFPGFFQQYKKYKYKGCSIAFYPIAKLPADPLQVSYDAGEPGIDPRDLANPILVHGCHGDDMGTILNKLYGDNNGISDSADRLDMNAIDWPYPDAGPWYQTMERLYYKALTDMTWKKASVQRGFRKSGLRPLVYSLATNHQIMPSSQYPNGMELAITGSPAMNGALPTSEYENEDDEYIENGLNRSNVQFFTPRLTRLGWMDTRQVLTTTGQVDAPDIEGIDLTPLDVALNTSLVEQVNWAQLPRLYMLMVLLPPAYKTEMYFRAVVTHYFQFKGFRGISFMPEQTGVPSMYTQEWSTTADGIVPKDFPDVPIDPPEGE